MCSDGGLARLTPLDLGEVRAALGPAGPDLSSLDALDAGSVNSNFLGIDGAGTRYFLRLYEEQGVEGAQRELAVLEQLSAAGVPVVAARAHQGRPWLGVAAGKPLAVFPWREGHMLCQRAVTPDAARRVGRALAQVHCAPVGRTPTDRFDPAELGRRLERVQRESRALAPDARRVERELLRVRASRDSALPRGLIHGDLFRDNVLWQGERISALLDFESACDGPYVYDLAVCLLAWCHGDVFEPPLLTAMSEGYQEVRPLGAAERAALPTEAALAALRFATTRMTDFSLRAPADQPPLRDYRRFLRRLEAVEGGALDGL